jgi:hypothetical protein
MQAPDLLDACPCTRHACPPAHLPTCPPTRPRDVTVLMLDRPRHADLIRQCREAGARIRLISDGDVAGAIEVAKAGAPVDMMMGVGGTPEGVIAGEPRTARLCKRRPRCRAGVLGRALAARGGAGMRGCTAPPADRLPLLAAPPLTACPSPCRAACALKCMGGHMLGRLWPRNDDERQRALEQGYDLQQVLTIDDLVKGDDVGAARRPLGLTVLASRLVVAAAGQLVPTGARRRAALHASLASAPAQPAPHPLPPPACLSPRSSSPPPACLTATCSRACATTLAAPPPTRSSCAASLAQVGGLAALAAHGQCWKCWKRRHS